MCPVNELDRLGDEAKTRAFEAIFAEYYPKIRGYLRRQGLSADRSSEVAQETFTRAWRSYDGFRGDASAATWLFTIARRLLLNELRSRRARKRDALEVSLDADPDGAFELSEEDASDPEAAVLDAESNRLLYGALESLPEQMRQCLMLRLGDLKYREIAAIQGISIETVKSHLHQGRRRLAGLLEEHFEIDLDDRHKGGTR